MSFILTGKTSSHSRRQKTYAKGGDPLILSQILDATFRGDVFPGKIPSRIYVENAPQGYTGEIVPNPIAATITTPAGPTIDQAFLLKVSSSADTELPINLTSAATASGTAAYTSGVISSITATTTVVTVTAANKFAGTETGVVIAGLTGALAVYNGTRTLTSASATQFTFALSGTALAATASTTGTATLTSATISNVAVVANTLTVTVVNAFTVGEVVVLANLPTAQASLNGGSVTILTVSGTQFTALAPAGTATAYPASLLTDVFVLGLEGPNFGF
jgi:hypothetical protein